MTVRSPGLGGRWALSERHPAPCSCSGFLCTRHPHPASSWDQEESGPAIPHTQAAAALAQSCGHCLPRQHQQRKKGRCTVPDADGAPAPLLSIRGCLQAPRPAQGTARARASPQEGPHPTSGQTPASRLPPPITAWRDPLMLHLRAQSPPGR